MAKIKIEGHIYHSQYSWSKEPTYDFFIFDASDEARVKVCPFVLEAEIPDNFDPRPARVQALQAEKEKLQRAFTARVCEINQRISELQCIEFNPTEPVAEVVESDGIPF